MEKNENKRTKKRKKTREKRVQGEGSAAVDE
jgi:hypothetical protein